MSLLVILEISQPCPCLFNRFIRTPDSKAHADLTRSLDHERASLECEVDAAERRHRECLLQYQELQDQETVKI